MAFHVVLPMHSPGKSWTELKQFGGCWYQVGLWGVRLDLESILKF